MTSSSTRNVALRRRYELLAPVYNAVGFESLLWAKARARAIELLRLDAGSAVLDVACGMGHNFELIEQRIGASGRLVGVDLTPGMLERARARTARRGWENVHLVESDAGELSAGLLEEQGALASGARVDAALCTLALSGIPDWEEAWRRMLALVRPGGRVAVMDSGYPDRPGAAGEVVVLRPLMWVIWQVAGGDPHRQPWELVVRDTDDHTVERFTWGYIAVAAGTARSTGPQ